MSEAIKNLESAMKRAAAGRPKVAGFPYLAETLRRAGVSRNIWSLPSCQSVFVTEKGPVVVQGIPLVSGFADVMTFSRESLIAALRADQAGHSTFPEFLTATWKAGVIGYEVDFAARTCTYHGVGGEKYVESYPEASVSAFAQ